MSNHPLQMGKLRPVSGAWVYRTPLLGVEAEGGRGGPAQPGLTQD